MKAVNTVTTFTIQNQGMDWALVLSQQDLPCSCSLTCTVASSATAAAVHFALPVACCICWFAVKAEMSARAARSRAALDAMSPAARLALEGVRPGAYVRIRLAGKPSPFERLSLSGCCVDASALIGPDQPRLGGLPCMLHLLASLMCCTYHLPTCLIMLFDLISLFVLSVSDQPLLTCSTASTQSPNCRSLYVMPLSLTVFLLRSLSLSYSLLRCPL